MDIKQQTVTLYARVSSQEQASEGVSIEAQLALLRSHAQAQGWWAGGRTLYGYRWLAAEQRWEINEDEAKVVRHVYDLYLNEKLGTGLIPFRLKEEGYRTRSGHRFGFTAVYQILSHPAYKGQHHKGFKVPAIVDEATWELAQARRQEARRVRKSVRYWLLQGRAFCGECGRCPDLPAERRH